MEGNSQNWQWGFTLVEILLALTLIGILVTMGAPPMRKLVVDTRVSAAAAGFERTLRHGRSEAVSRGQSVRICPSRDGWLCDPLGRWNAGWISYVDLAGNADRDETDPLLRSYRASMDLDIRYNGGERISINALGRISRNASMDFCSPRDGHPGRRLVMIHSGRLRVESPSPGCRIL